MKPKLNECKIPGWNDLREDQKMAVIRERKNKNWLWAMQGVAIGPCDGLTEEEFNWYLNSPLPLYSL